MKSDANATAIVSAPKPETLKKYGLTAEEWLGILEEQGGVCAVCLKLPASGRLVTDHDHVPRWKKLKPELRRTYVRGILCWFCNANYVGRSITLQKARNVVRYLLAHEMKLHGAPF